MGKIGQSFTTDERIVLLIDEIDKADTDFQDDMLAVLHTRVRHVPGV